MTPEEFQEHYDRAINIIQSIKDSRSDDTLAEKYQNKKVHSWVLWSKVKAVLTGLRNKTCDLKELYGYFRDDSENLSGEAFLSELIVGSNSVTILADERLPCKV